ncbi:hypothetical protein COK06_22950 [Bacillus cereus]|nr:hypothetical protein COK06_22950 [Bacillus cereus]
MKNINWTIETKKQQRVMKEVSENLLPILIRLSEKLEKQRQELINTDYKDKNLDTDLRLIIFQPIINELNTLIVKYFAYKNTWLNDDWIEDALGNINIEDIAKAICISMDGVLRSDFYGFIQLIFGTFDDAIREIMRAYDNRSYPEAMGFVDRIQKLSYEVISDFGEETQEEFINVFIMLSHIRNTIHNGGIHMNPFIEEDELTLTYKSCTIVYKQGHPIKFIKFEDPLILVEGCIKGIYTIIKDKEIVKISDKKAKLKTNKLVNIFPRQND